MSRSIQILVHTNDEPLAAFARDAYVMIDEPVRGEIAAMEKTIGTATLTPDGSIFMRLRAEGPGMVGYGSLTIARSDRRYESILSHIGGLAPGETKLVAPFPAPDPK